MKNSKTQTVDSKPQTPGVCQGGMAHQTCRVWEPLERIKGEKCSILFSILWFSPIGAGLYYSMGPEEFGDIAKKSRKNDEKLEQLFSKDDSALVTPAIGRPKRQL